MNKTNKFGTLSLVPVIAASALLSACSSFQSRPSAPEPAPSVVSTATETPPAVTAKMAAARQQLSQMVALQDRLYRVAGPLLINNADLCRSQARNLLGFTAKNKYSYTGEFVDAAQAVLNYGDRLEVASVLAGSGAARAGLRKGDVLVAADGKLLPVGANAESDAAAVLGPLVSNNKILTLSISRGGSNQQLRVPVTRACAFKIDIGNSDNINAYSDGQRVMITRGMVNFAQTDDAIAYVLAKDIAHNVLGHAATTKQAYTVGGIIDNLVTVRPDLSMLIGTAGVKPMPQELDAAADNLSLYMVARAGYNVEGARAFWQRLATQYPATVLNGYTANHPAVNYRLGVIDKTVSAIRSKQSSKQPLVP
ncbi:M48 family metalloprotease [Duganella sp. sic0402]|uniref:M48 family metallopeptidase n=1 Tax=Duganella sp. sic0402 TaxID=2854786 RepID=UPI001C449B64|nr:M48 family metallopeptidase [Duganella sp. sic0402]MBV7536956.1 M48 family metalloprotease [Duganella sp. sic0402]